MDRIDDVEENLYSTIYTFLLENKVVAAMLIFGLILIIGGCVVLAASNNATALDIVSTDEVDVSVTIEVSGAVNAAGVFTLNQGTRVIDAISAAGGFSSDADTSWIDKYLNNARVLDDGEKLYIPTINEQSKDKSANENVGDQTISVGNYAENGNSVNINTASISELESLWGIGRITAQNIIDQRPYSKVDDLLDRKILKENIYERNKDLLTVY